MPRKYVDKDGGLWLKSGDYGKDKNGTWQARTPDGHSGNLAAHEVIEHEDGTISVSPSIFISELDPKGNRVKELYHGYLTKGIWRTV